MTFYTLGRKTASGNSGKNDEQDFELMGSSGKFITNAFLDGQQSNYVEHPRTETRYEFCISYDGTTTRYYQNGVELPDTAKKLAFDEPQYTWFSIWVPGNIWKNCCGALPSPSLTPQWVQTIENFSLYVAS
ncbi:hypothetical protein BKA69DRAFT_1129107 [Paraphysoderma sedebokerense]|nr:hypothetical protein BKA69DRAFT_1129107 [Paraphysoderma sedebokerense]